MFGERPTRHRKGVRLPAFDYSQPGTYYVTICTDRRRCVFGTIVDGRMRLSGLGEIVRERWTAIPAHHAGVEIDAFVVMPNHVHGILRIVDPPDTMRPSNRLTNGPAPRSVAAIIGSFKAGVTRQHRQCGDASMTSIWQRGFHDHVIRNDHALERIRQYIAANPANWPADPENPRRLRHGGATQASPLQDDGRCDDVHARSRS